MCFHLNNSVSELWIIEGPCMDQELGRIKDEYWWIKNWVEFRTGVDQYLLKGLKFRLKILLDL